MIVYGEVHTVRLPYGMDPRFAELDVECDALIAKWDAERAARKLEKRAHWTAVRAARTERRLKRPGR